MGRNNVTNGHNWEMQGNGNFRLLYKGYEAILSPRRKWNIWHILKDGVIVDQCYYHMPSHGELQGKYQIQNIINDKVQASSREK